MSVITRNCRMLAAVQVFLWLLCLSMPVTAAAGPTAAIRVSLGQNLGQVDIQVEQGHYQIIDTQNGKQIGLATPGVIWTVKKEGNSLRLSRGGALDGIFSGPLHLRAESSDSLCLFRYQGKRYRGDLAVYGGAGGLAAVNILDLEDYLYGVVAKEMVTTAGMEALKAQAIVCRTYTLFVAKPDGFYDITADSSNQVYSGYEAEQVAGFERVRQAVDATRGQVIYYDDQLICAYYHANSGGHTEDSENVWSTSLPYLRGVPSPEDVWALEYPSRSPTGWPAYNYTWSVSFTQQELLEKVNKWLAGQGRPPVRRINDLVVSRLKQGGQGETVSGRVTRLDIYTDTGPVSVVNNNIRSVFGLPSTLFTIQSQSAVNILDGSGQLKQAEPDSLMAVAAAGVSSIPNGTKGDYTVLGINGSRTLSKSSGRVVFQGRGNGHGLGMSQWGAMGMAEKGYTCKEIIEHYYNRGNLDGRLKIVSQLSAGR